jgi:hypothetical protein
MCDGAESVASSSHRSYANYSDAQGGDVHKSIAKLYKLLSCDGTVTSKDHVTAADLLMAVQREMAQGSSVDRRSQTLLMCILSSLHRRTARMEELAALEQDEVMRSEVRAEREQFMQTAVLTFVVMSTGDLVARNYVSIDEDAARAELGEYMARSLWEELCQPPNRKRTIDEAFCEANGAESTDPVDPSLIERAELEALCEMPILSDPSTTAWSALLFQPGATAGAVLRLASSMLSHSVNTTPFKDLMLLFSRHSIHQMKVNTLRTRDDGDFVCLSSRRFVDASERAREERLLAVAQAGESELGQQVLRDLMLSFLLPKSVVGTRRTLALSREASNAATAGFPFITEMAHQVAMQGCEFVWQNSKSQLKRTCALLAGFAMLTTKGTDDIVRKATAFSGLVDLPFLETAPPSSNSRQRLALVPSERRWVIYKVSPSGMPLPEVSARGFEGLLLATLAFCENG